MKYTAKQKADIRGWWAMYYRVRFMADGSVWGSADRPGEAWGILLTARQAEEHLRTRGLL